ncbi:MAG: protease modulator HflC [Phycisphaerales bacterium]
MTLAIVLAIVAFMTTYTVRFTESAVVTTFGKADDKSVVSEPGLRWRFPYPIQTVTKYETRTRFVESRPETLQTGDNRLIVVTSFITYRVGDPLRFYQAFSNAGSGAAAHFKQAEKALQDKLRFAMGGQMGRFKMDQLFTATGGPESPGGLPDLEKAILAQLDTGGGDSPALSSYGIVPIAVGISSIKMPEETSKAVFNRMSATRQRIAQEAVSKGNAESSRIRSEADSAAQKILAFAERRAKAIRGQGDLEAAQYFARQSTDPELAVFLKNLDFMREALAKNVTLVLPTNLPGLGLLNPDALSGVPRGQLPPFTLGGLSRAPEPRVKPGEPGATPAPAPAPAAPAKPASEGTPR